MIDKDEMARDVQEAERMVIFESTGLSKYYAEPPVGIGESTLKRAGEIADVLREKGYRKIPSNDQLREILMAIIWNEDPHVATEAIIKSLEDS